MNSAKIAFNFLRIHDFVYTALITQSKWRLMCNSISCITYRTRNEIRFWLLGSVAKNIDRQDTA